MLIGITGDTHDVYQALEKIAKKGANVDCWLFTGDVLPDADMLSELTGKEVYAVGGNNDWGYSAEKYSNIIELEGFRVWLTHGHRYLYDLLGEARTREADIVVYGHTHVPDISWHEGMLFINPGSPAYPRRGSKKGFVRLGLCKGKKPSVEFIQL